MPLQGFSEEGREGDLDRQEDRATTLSDRDDEARNPASHTEHCGRSWLWQAPPQSCRKEQSLLMPGVVV